MGPSAPHAVPTNTSFSVPCRLVAPLITAVVAPTAAPPTDIAATMDAPPGHVRARDHCQGPVNGPMMIPPTIEPRKRPELDCVFPMA